MPKTILLIEDNPLLTGLYKSAFEKEGVEMLVTHDGKEGLAIVKEKHPDLVLLDFLMVGMDGFDVLEQLKSDPSTKDIKVIMLTIASEQQHKDRARQLGATAYLVKSDLTINDIVKAVMASL